MITDFSVMRVHNCITANMLCDGGATDSQSGIKGQMSVNCGLWRIQKAVTLRHLDMPQDRWLDTSSFCFSCLNPFPSSLSHIHIYLKITFKKIFDTRDARICDLLKFESFFFLCFLGCRGGGDTDNI